jgi:hypothetical protein
MRLSNIAKPFGGVPVGPLDPRQKPARILLSQLRGAETPLGLLKISQAGAEDALPPGENCRTFAHEEFSWL